MGWHDTILLTKDWVKRIFSVSDPNSLSNYHGYKVSLHRIALILLNPDLSAGKLNVFNCSVRLVGLVVRCVCMAWVLMVASYFLTTVAVKPCPNAGRLAFVLDISVLLFCLFPVLPILEPHHLVVMVVPAIALIHIMFDAKFPVKYRAVAGLTVGVGACATEFAHHPFHGVGVMLTLLVYLIGIWILRYFAFRRPSEPSKISSNTLN